MRHSYLVMWEIEVPANTPVEAARECLKIQRDPESTATVFEVVDTDTGEMTRVDLEEVDQEE